MIKRCGMARIDMDQAYNARDLIPGFAGFYSENIYVE